jgi:hypothetical protein
MRSWLRVIGTGLVALLLVFGVLALTTRTAHAENSVLYLQGRAWGSWSSERVSAAGWTQRTLDFNGNARLDGYETNVIVRNAIQTYCSGANNCVILCYSAGCNRALKAIDDLRASGNTLPGLFWIEAAGSAAGGTKLAEMATGGFVGFMAKLFGQQEKIDFDLSPGAARGTWGYTQDAVPPDAMYHTAGNLDICKGFWIFKLCGNAYIDAGVADGLVGFDSAAGASAQGRYYDGCAAAKYPGRLWQSGVPCGGEARDHFGIVGRVVTLLAPQVQGTGTDKMLRWGENLSAASCNAALFECDHPAAVTSMDFSRTLAAAQVATDVSGVTSPTTGQTKGPTCAGKCGGSSGTTCWCDGGCVARGDCCADYTAVRCNLVNAQ